MRPGNKNFEDQDLRGADFSNINLSGAEFSDSSLSSANFKNAKLSNVGFSRAELDGADFSGAELNNVGFSCAELDGADFSGAELDNVGFSCAELDSADFFHVNVDGAVFSDCNLNSADFGGSELINADFLGADLSAANFQDTRFENVDFRDVHAFNVDLSHVDLTDVNLNYADFTLGQFEESSLEEMTIYGVNMYSSNLKKARLGTSNLIDPSLVDANLYKADIRQTTFLKPDIRGMKIESARLSGSTKFKRFSWEPESTRGWDTLAKSYEKIREEFKENALNTSQKSLYYLQRRARTVEALSEGRRISFIIGGASELVTGYGVRAKHPLVWTILLMSLSALWYSYVPITTWEGGPIHYSIATFVTSAPHPPNSLQSDFLDIITQLVVLVETYLGTVLIILLGYVLGNRDVF
ncbi:pentapeptide repeat-containing protein [Halorubrum sp. SD626R]|uniref:pentapeptide repeat-containing protein n=1 Tax=Halorubrum sp. SD626R TaxID=1419722 RepID=UPI000A403AB7|nr:pentapeptide repeat-containing protein [Halorubrum sp. SD626R]